MPGNVSTRRRKLPGPDIRWTNSMTRNWDSLVYYNNSGGESLPGTQVTVSEGHQWPPPKKGDLIDRGGAFRTSKSWIVSPAPTMPTTKLIYKDNNFTYEYVGPVIPPFPGSAGARPFPPSQESSDSILDQKGATAISRCKPTNSVADVSTFLGELVKEGLPNLIGSTFWKSKTHNARRKAAAGEYLNVQFGWMPMVNEVSKFADAIRRADKVLKQYERDAGRVVRRRYYFPLETNYERTKYMENTYCYNGSFTPLAVHVGRGDVFLERKISKRRWFSGAFTYYLPSGYESRNGMARLAAQAEKLFGISITPEVLWNLAPWSWATDWFVNTGDVISNLEDFKLYGLVMRYGYMMEHSIITDTYTFEPYTRTASTPNITPLVFRTEVKKRRMANPFGFGVSWEGLSSFQLSIAAALGLSRGR